MYAEGAATHTPSMSDVLGGASFFCPAKTFAGPRRGMVFKLGARGLGYYSDDDTDTLAPRTPSVSEEDDEENNDDYVEEVGPCVPQFGPMPRGYVRGPPHVEARYAKADEFNRFITRVGEELTMPETTFRAIVRILETNPERITSQTVAELVHDATGDFLSAAQSAELINLYFRHTAGGNAVGGDNLIDLVSMISCDRWNLDGQRHAHGACYYATPLREMAPPEELLDRYYARMYFGLDWAKAYTYSEARPLIMREVMPRGIGGHPGGYWDPAWTEPIALGYGERAWRRPEALRRLGRLIKVAPLLGRFALAMRAWYEEVSLRPEHSAAKACRGRFEAACVAYDLGDGAVTAARGAAAEAAMASAPLGDAATAHVYRRFDTQKRQRAGMEVRREPGAGH